MTHGNDLAYPACDINYHEGVPVFELVHRGLTKLEYFAAKDNTPLPDSFAHKKLKEFNERTKQTRSTAGSAFEMMTAEEGVETRQAWKVLCAKALINELNK